ncbi:hypothetical protein EBA03_10885 [Xanthomonas oryzae pv. oryzae]|nr:hypothetical protein EBA03_10885 [Xanthomonas oryzae pv. oryzae]
MVCRTARSPCRTGLPDRRWRGFTRRAQPARTAPGAGSHPRAPRSLAYLLVDHDDGATQVIAPPEVGFALECIDLRHAADAHAQAQHDSELEAQTAFDLTRGPLIRGRLLRLADEEHRLLVTMHHIVSDGWSMGLLVNELSTLYAAFAQGQPDPLPPLPTSTPTYTLWPAALAARPGAAAPARLLARSTCTVHRHCWKLPTDRPRPPLQDYSGDSVEFALDAELTSTLVALSQRHGTTVFMTVLAAWGVLAGAPVRPGPGR